MNKIKLEAYVIDGKTSRQIATLENVSQTNVRYWLKKYKIALKQHHTYSKIEDGIRQCTKCGEPKSISEFYKKKTSLHTKCKSCFNVDSIARLRAVKQQAVNYKGGKCQSCGYDRYIGGLEFHHLDPSEKDIEISKFNRTISNAEMRAELDKCVLLCALCHRETHAGLLEVISVGLEPTTP